MKRELNPIIFGQIATPELGRSVSAFDETGVPGLILPNEVREELKLLRSDLFDLEKENARDAGENAHKIRALAEQFTQHFEHLSQRVDSLEDALKEKQVEQLEQNQVNQKIEALLERHNEIVRNFENKMTHLTRILSEQEIQILNSKSALEEAHRELARLRS